MTSQSPASGTVAAFTRDDYRRLAARIKKLRASRGWKQRELSRRAGISADRLSRLERGAPVRVDELAALSHAFGLGIDELMFAPPHSGAPDELDQLARQIRAILRPRDLSVLIHLAQALVEGLRSLRGNEPKGEDE